MSAEDIAAIRKEWAARGFSCQVWTDPPGRRWEDFRHETDELVLAIEGDVEFEIEGVVSRPKPGDELLIPARALHSARNVGSTTTRWLYGYRR